MSTIWNNINAYQEQCLQFEIIPMHIRNNVYNYRRISMAGRYPEEGCPRECVRMWRDPDRSPARHHGGTLRQNVSANSCCDTSTETRQTFKTKSKHTETRQTFKTKANTQKHDRLLKRRANASPHGSVLQQDSNLTDIMQMTFPRSWQSFICLNVPSVLCVTKTHNQVHKSLRLVIATVPD